MQGIVGSIPWTALVFFTLYLQLLGMSDFAASVLMSLFLGSTGQHRPFHACNTKALRVTPALCSPLKEGRSPYCTPIKTVNQRKSMFTDAPSVIAALGGLLGGYVGDYAAKGWPHHGRIFACQFSVAIGIPFSVLILKVDG